MSSGVDTEMFVLVVAMGGKISAEINVVVFRIQRHAVLRTFVPL